MKEKPMCGLWHSNVEASDYNSNGLCACIGCFGATCHECSVYKKLAEKIESVLKKTHCQKCLEYKNKTR